MVVEAPFLGVRLADKLKRGSRWSAALVGRRAGKKKGDPSALRNLRPREHLIGQEVPDADPRPQGLL